MWWKILLVGSGGFLGAVLLFSMSELLARLNWKLPIATLLVNYIGSFILGLILFGMLKGNSINEQHRLLIAVGFCGALTTMSSFAYEGYQLLSLREWLIAIGYIVAQVLGCLLMIFLARILI